MGQSDVQSRRRRVVGYMHGDTNQQEPFLMVPENGGALQEMVVNLRATPVLRVAFPIFLGVPHQYVIHAGVHHGACMKVGMYKYIG